MTIRPTLIAALALLPLSTLALAAEPPLIPGPPKIQTPSMPTTATQQQMPPAQETIVCPDGSIVTKDPSTRPATKPSTASAIGGLAKGDAATGAAVTGAIPATKPYSSAISPQSASPAPQTAQADPCAKADPLKSIAPKY